MYTHTTECYSVIKRRNPTICNNMDGSWGHYAKWNVRQRKTNTIWSHLGVETIKNKPVETETRLLVRGSGKQWRNWVKKKKKSWNIKTSSYKINKFWRCNVQHDDHSNHCVCVSSVVPDFEMPWTVVHGFSVHGIFQAKILEWVVISFSRDLLDTGIKPVSLSLLHLQAGSFTTLSEGKESACNTRDLDWIPGSGRSPIEGNGTTFQYSCLENPTDGGAW